MHSLGTTVAGMRFRIEGLYYGVRTAKMIDYCPVEYATAIFT